MKKVTKSTASHVNACSPPIAIAPIVSTTTIADIRKRIVSSRRSSRRSRAFCSVAAALMTAALPGPLSDRFHPGDILAG